MSERTTVRWGILATGGIAASFVSDLLTDPTKRGTEDILHQVVAVASSSSIDSANRFIDKSVTPKQSGIKCAAYASYEELVKDDNVDIIYIATPHSHHFQNCMLCLSAGKSVLCEKAFTVNAAQARLLYKTAGEKKLFLMEAVWTRYFPISVAIRKHITDGDLGEVLRVTADLSVGEMPEDAWDASHRMVNKDLAGGCLLDLGIYALTWVFQTMYHTLPKDQREKPKVAGAAITHEPRTGADEMTTMLLEFPKSTPTGSSKGHAMATAAFRVDWDPDNQNSAGPAVRVQGTKAELQVYGPVYCPTKYRIITKVAQKEKDKGVKGIVTEKTFDTRRGGTGMFWEADEAARCWKDKKLESEGLGWEESTVIMEVMDEVRRQGGLTYPEVIETTEYPVNLRAKGL